MAEAFSFYSFPRRALSDDSVASHLHSNSGSTCLRCYIYAIIWTNPYWFLVIFPLTVLNGGSRPAKNSLHVSAHPVLIEQNVKMRTRPALSVFSLYGVDCAVEGHDEIVYALLYCTVR
jgi:hypothetical protein